MPVTVDLDAQGNLRVHLPGPDLGHHVTLPCSVDGLRLLTQTLRAQAIDDRIGTEGSPTQQMVEAWLREHGATTEQKMRERELEAAGVKLDLAGIDL